jgi:threonine dehydrogenase-like Zn-dependent dehydrogenase
VLREFPWGNHEKRGPRYIVQGSYADSVTVPYGGAFLREISMIFPRSEQDRDRSVVFDMLKRGALTMKPVLSAVRRPEEAQKTYDQLKDAGSGMLSAVFDWKN